MSTLRWVSGVILVAWAAWWAFFAFAQTPPLPVAAGVSVLLFAVPLLAWKWRGLGGALLVAEGLSLLVWISTLVNPLPTSLFLAATLGLPPFTAGLVLLLDGWKSGTLLPKPPLQGSAPGD